MRISILLFDGFTMLDAVGGYAVLGWLPGAEVEFVAERKTIIADDLRSAGIDGAFYLARLIAGEEIAKTIQLGIEYYPNPPFSYGSADDAPENIHNTIRAAEETGLLEQMETTQPRFLQPSL